MTTTNDNLKPAKRQPVRTADPDGAAIVLVLLATGQTAVIDAADFDRLRKLGFTDQWTFNWGRDRKQRYVRCAGRGPTDRLFTVARLILEAAAGTRIYYRDGNRLNLRQANLKVSSGHATKAREQHAVRAARFRTMMALASRIEKEERAA